MGGVVNTVKKQSDTFGRIFSGKGKFSDVASSIFYPGMSTKDHPGPPGPPDPNDPFTFNGQQAQADEDSINALANRQYGDSQDFIRSDQSQRQMSRDQLAKLLTQQAQQSFAQTLPSTAEDYNAGHLLNSSGYGNEVARQQAYLASGIANQIGQVGLQDINRSSDIGLSALQGQQQQQAAALSRGFSLQDFTRQAILAKAIGVQAAPQVGNGKGAGVSGGLAGASAGATVGSAVPVLGTGLGALLGGAAGYYAGTQR